MVREFILVPVKSSAWATPIVPDLKSGGKIRVVGGFKVTD